ncbi:MAG: hypothetical protein ABFR36_07605 [Acidobacteriota bacterium]
MYNKLTSIPRIESTTGEKDSIEWQIPQQVSVAFMFTKETGYSFIAKVKVEKKHWWNRPWETFITHATDQSEAIGKGQEFLEIHGYKIDPDTARFEDKENPPVHF